MATISVPYISDTEASAISGTNRTYTPSSLNGKLVNPYSIGTTEYKNVRNERDYTVVNGSSDANVHNNLAYHRNKNGIYIRNTVPLSSNKDDYWNGLREGAGGVNYGINSLSPTKDMNSVIMDLNNALNLPAIESEYNAFVHTTTHYNRFKIPNPNLALQKGFPHVFFTRPECNIIDTNGNLAPTLSGIEYFKYVAKSMPDVMKELTKTGHNNDFMFSLSNASNSFSTSDEYIGTETYGRGYTGYKIIFGKNDIESKTANDFTVEFLDDRNMHIYKLIRAWVTYISKAFRGEINVPAQYIKHKILNYVSSVYYIVTAENGEDIIFWSKYYGVFPSTIPSNQFSWAAGNAISDSKLSIEFKYSFKEDYNPIALGEFNKNAKITAPSKFLKSYDGNLGHSGTTWSSCPFIEAVRDGNSPYYYRLKFKR